MLSFLNFFLFLLHGYCLNLVIFALSVCTILRVARPDSPPLPSHTHMESGAKEEEEEDHSALFDAKNRLGWSELPKGKGTNLTKVTQNEI